MTITKSQIWLSLLLTVSIIINIIFVSAMLTENTSGQAVLADGETVMDYSFAGIVGDPKTQLLAAISGASATLDIAIYNLEDADIVETILETKERGVEVRLIVDAEKADNKSRAKLLTELKDAGIEIKVNPEQKMHLKLTIADAEQVVTGSYNYTESSAYENLEQLLTVQNDELAQEWVDVFDQLWTSNDYVLWEKE
ncbi:PLD-like domain-containing protein [Evansella caseinilytica]|uniref:phospholipase D n=1 Tax=Evansella caseinilytica TaxID=1503961 RepID=A0A1H3Q4Z8_9BACI|nr:phospholipase D-like domain-containing protein [Evansella caseinilytica]SDZ08622.1 PLD-like domain-containing protein [Evansella caseinilytica]